MTTGQFPTDINDPRYGSVSVPQFQGLQSTNPALAYQLATHGGQSYRDAIMQGNGWTNEQMNQWLNNAGYNQGGLQYRFNGGGMPPPQSGGQLPAGTHSMRAIAAGYPPGTTFSMRTGQPVAPPPGMQLNRALQQSQLAPQLANVNGQNVMTGQGQAVQANGMGAGPGGMNSLMGGSGPINSVGPAYSAGSIIKMAGGPTQGVAGQATPMGNPPVDPNKQPVGGIQGTPPPLPGGGSTTGVTSVPPSGPTTTGGPGTGPGAGGGQRLIGSSLGTGPMFPPSVPSSAPGPQPGDVYQAYLNYLTGANHGNSLPLFHYQPGAATLPSFNASGVLQAQRQMNGINPQQGYVPYGGLPGSNTQLPRAGGNTLNSTLANSGLYGG